MTPSTYWFSKGRLSTSHIVFTTHNQRNVLEDVYCVTDRAESSIRAIEWGCRQWEEYKVRTGGGKGVS